jgi:hypothetical protein
MSQGAIVGLAPNGEAARERVGAMMSGVAA